MAVLLAITTALGWINGWGLLVFTFALACGAALNTPAWAATLPELVPRAQLQSAIALNSLGINLARAIGPAIAGVVVAVSGPQAAFLLNALSFIAVIIVLWRWRRETQPSTLPAERFFGAMRAGMRYVREATSLQFVMARAAGFFVFATGTWALLPLVARDSGGGAGAYGLLLAGIGTGAVTAAIVMPRLRRRFTRDALVRGATGLYATATAGVAVADTLYRVAGRDAGRRRSVARRAVHSACQRTDCCAAMGARSCIVVLSDGLRDGHDRRRPAVGCRSRALGGAAGTGIVCCRRIAGDGCDVAVDIGW